MLHNTIIRGRQKGRLINCEETELEIVDEVKNKF